MKRYLSFAVLFMSVFVFTACPSDDDDNDKGKANNALVGYWNIPTLKYAMVLYNEGIIIGENYNKLSYSLHSGYDLPINNWNYNEQTGILATSAVYNNNNLQWHLTMVNDNNWAGLALWNDKNTTYTASNNIDAYEIAILLYGTWTNDKGEKLKFGNIANGTKNGKEYISVGFSTDAKPDYKLIYTTGGFNYTIFKETDNSITLEHYYSNYQRFLELGVDKYLRNYSYIVTRDAKLVINNPYSYYNRSIDLYVSETGVYDNKHTETFRLNCKNFHLQK